MAEWAGAAGLKRFMNSRNFSRRSGTTLPGISGFADMDNNLSIADIVGSACVRFLRAEKNLWVAIPGGTVLGSEKPGPADDVRAGAARSRSRRGEVDFLGYPGDFSAFPRVSEESHHVAEPHPAPGAFPALLEYSTIDELLVVEGGGGLAIAVHEVLDVSVCPVGIVQLQFEIVDD